MLLSLLQYVVSTTIHSRMYIKSGSVRTIECDEPAAGQAEQSKLRQE